jgi:Taurine catabolism dioxygenase TauD, TfdA family
MFPFGWEFNISIDFVSDIRAYANYGGDYHSDHSFEVNPPAYTMLRMVRTPDFGGDTIFTSQTALFDKLSPTFQKLFEGLHGVHSSEVGLTFCCFLRDLFFCLRIFLARLCKLDQQGHCSIPWASPPRASLGKFSLRDSLRQD